MKGEVCIIDDQRESVCVCLYERVHMCVYIYMCIYVTYKCKCVCVFVPWVKLILSFKYGF